jgi:cell division topological specificity factor
MVSFASLIGVEKHKTAGIAKERLQIIFSLERAEGSTNKSDCLEELQHELVKVVGRFVKLDPSDIKVRLERQESLEILEVKVELPDGSLKR